MSLLLQAPFVLFFHLACHYDLLLSREIEAIEKSFDNFSPLSCLTPLARATMSIGSVPAIVRAAISKIVRYALHFLRYALLRTVSCFLRFLASFSACRPYGCRIQHHRLGHVFAQPPSAHFRLSYARHHPAQRYAGLCSSGSTNSTCGNNVLPLSMSTLRYLRLALELSSYLRLQKSSKVTILAVLRSAGITASVFLRCHLQLVVYEAPADFFLLYGLFCSSALRLPGRLSLLSYRPRTLSASLTMAPPA